MSSLLPSFRGKSRSASVVLAYLMQKNCWSLERALKKVRARRECVSPHAGFMAQLKLYESMNYSIDGSNVQFKMFREGLARTNGLFREFLAQELLRRLNLYRMFVSCFVGVLVNI